MCLGVTEIYCTIEKGKHSSLILNSSYALGLMTFAAGPITMSVGGEP